MAHTSFAVMVALFSIAVASPEQSCAQPTLTQSEMEQLDEQTEEVMLLQTAMHVHSLNNNSARESVMSAALNEEEVSTVRKGLAEVAAMTLLSAAFGEGEASTVQKGLAEMAAMILFVFIGCGSAMAVKNEHGWLQVALTFGLAITALAYSIGHISGGQINCAVSFGLWLSGQLTLVQMLVNTAFQLLGAVIGSMLTMAVFPFDKDKTGGLGTNEVQEGFSVMRALVGEIMGTCVLVFVVLETAINPATSANRALACMAIGISVFLAHSVLIPVDGCSINPTRSFGPAVVRAVFRSDKGDKKYLTQLWIFWVGPLAGAGLAALVYKFVH